MGILRHKTKVISIGRVRIGGSNPVAIQSMAKAKTSDVKKVVKQIHELERAGCDIIRVSVKDVADALAIREIKKRVNLPIVADIHFDGRLALRSIESGADKIRLNPGNIRNVSQIKEVVAALKEARRPLRIGVNSGSVGELNNKRLSPADKLVTSCLNYVKIIERLKFFDMVISLKASNVLDTVEAYRKIAKLVDYPLHLGVTATGLPYQGAIKSSIALGSLLLEGLGDTLRISLTDEPCQEVKVAKIILESLGMRSFGPEIISCPTCGRCEVDLAKVVKKLEKALAGSTAHGRAPSQAKPSARLRLGAGKPFKVAVMGCVVNGPGEAKEADLGIAFGKKEGLLFRNGKPVKKVSYSDCVAVLLNEMEAKW